MDVFINLMSLLLWTLIWAFGGYLILVSLFKVQRHEATLLGFGLGLVLQAWVSNLLARFFAPVNVICRNAPFTMNFSATDPDPNDSLAYSLCNALNGGASVNAGFDDPGLFGSRYR